MQEKLDGHEQDNRLLRKDLERERQVDMLPERSQVAALKDQNERLHLELEKMRDKQNDKVMILERELDQMRDAMNSKQIAIENL